jgi:hypothetical protein
MEKIVFNTDGVRGLWSDKAKAVEIVDMRVTYCDEKEFGELQIAFNEDTWDIEQDGLIYTDTGFMAEMREFLNAHGLAGADVDYSEQGMQGDDYVSCDIGKAFIASWEAKFGAESIAHLLD